MTLYFTRALLPSLKRITKVPVPFLAAALSLILTRTTDFDTPVTLIVEPAAPVIRATEVKFLPVIAAATVLPGTPDAVTCIATGVGIAVTAGATKSMDESARSASLASATSMMQPLKLVALVPQDPLPTVPATTLTDVEGNVPVELTVMVARGEVSQPAGVVAVARHSTA